MLLHIILGIAVIVVIVKVYLKLSIGYTSEDVDMTGKVCIVTGANVGLGFYTAKILAKNGAHVIMAVRSEQRGKAAIEEIKREYPNAQLTLLQIDVSNLSSVVEFVKKFEALNLPLHVLINNAGVASYTESPDQEYEKMFMTNHVGHYLLTKKLLPILKKNKDDSRIVIVSSDAHKFVKKLNEENVERFCKHPLQRFSGVATGDMMAQYGFTKLCNLYHLYALHEELSSSSDHHVTVNALHPGTVSTEFSRELNNFPWYQQIFVTPVFTFLLIFFRSVRDGAQTSIHLACSPSVRNISGRYWADCKEAPTTRRAKNQEIRKQLMRISEQIVQPFASM